MRSEAGWGKHAMEKWVGAFGVKLCRAPLGAYPSMKDPFFFYHFASRKGPGTCSRTQLHIRTVGEEPAQLGAELSKSSA